MAQPAGRLRGSLGALRQVFANENLRRLQLASAGSLIGSWAYTVALAVYAYDAGGATAVGIAALIRSVPAALTAPFGAALADRYSRVAVMLTSDLLRVALMAAMAAAAWAGAPALTVYLLAALVTVSSTPFRPAKSAVLPSLARTPDELTAANVASSTIESLGIFLGPALGGILLAATDPGAAFAANGISFLWSAFLVARIRLPRDAAPRAEPAARRAGPLAQMVAGFGLVAREASVRAIVLLTAAQTLVYGALTVFVVVLALEELDLGAAGVGFLNSALGIGGLLGSIGSFALIGRRRLAAAFGAGVALWGLPLAFVGAWPETVIALVLFGVVGGANTLVDVSGLTLLQRHVDDAVLARVFGVLQGLAIISVALGAMAAPALIELFGTRTALVVTGAFLPVLAALSWRRLATIDAAAPVRTEELALLRSLPMFAPLPVAALEQLAARLVRVEVRTGDTVIRAGDAGDRFYAIAAGEADVTADGRTSRLRAGEYFGEIALVRDIRRTATVTAATGLSLYALDREDFLAAIRGSEASIDAAEAIVTTRLGAARPSPATI